MPGRKVAGIQQKRRSGSGRECGDARSGPENANQAAGSERESEEKTVQRKVLAHQEISGLPEKPHEDRGEEAAEK